MSRALKLGALVAVVGSSAGALWLMLESRDATALAGARPAALGQARPAKVEVASVAEARQNAAAAPRPVTLAPPRPIAGSSGDTTNDAEALGGPLAARPGRGLAPAPGKAAPTREAAREKDTANEPTAKAQELSPELHERFVATVLEDLRDQNPRHRINALRIARDLDLPEVMGEVKRLAVEDPDALTRRFAVQALALDDHFADHQDVFLRLLDDPDWSIRANATLGLARMGDESAQGDLLSLMQKLKAESSSSLDGVQRAVASPDLHGRRMIDYYRARMTDPLVSADEHRNAALILAAKEQAASAVASR